MDCFYPGSLPGKCRVVIVNASVGYLGHFRSVCRTDNRCRKLSRHLVEDKAHWK